MTKLIVAGLLGELDLGDQDRFDPVATFHDRRDDALAPSAASFLRQINKGARRAADVLQATIEARRELFGEAGADPAGEQKAARTVVTDKESPEVFAAGFGV